MSTTTKKTSNIQVAMGFAIMFIFGSLILMIGYTQGGLSKVLFGSGKSHMTYLLVAQSFGLIIATLLTSKLIKNFNIRWIFVAGFLTSAVMLILISLIDKIAPNTTGGYNTKGIVFFTIFSLILGICIGPMSPLVSTYFSANFKGNGLSKMLGASNGVYGIGAGILPLAASPLIYKLGNASGLGEVRYFYFIAAALAVLGAVCGFFLNFKHSKQLTSSKIIDSKDGKVVNFNIWKPLIISLVIMSFYMIGETVANYMFVNIATAKHHGFTNEQIKDLKINASMAFGLFVMVQGLWRTFSGFFVAPHVSKQNFIYGSIALFGAGLILIMSGMLQHTYGQFIVAILFGLGVGNLWPIIYGYAIDIDPNRASFIGMAVNIVAMFWIPVTQLMIAPIWTSVQNDGTFSFYIPVIIGLVSVIALGALTVYSSIYFKKFRKQNNIKLDSE